MEIGAGLGLRQGEAFGLSLDDFDFEEGVVHIRRQVKMVRASLCFALPKGRKVRDVALPSSIGEAAQRTRPRSRPCRSPWPGTTPAHRRHQWRPSTAGPGRTTCS
ncbi:hypothetical protein OID54_29350 [Streptomyces sp. NBC_00690]|nr:hypothetical protein [Streptomyces sp. NBC_00690]